MTRSREEIIKLLKAQVHKPEVNRNDWDHVHPNLLLLGEFTVDHCTEHHLPVIFSSIFRPMLKISKTDIHASTGSFTDRDGLVHEFKGRAYDLSVRGWQLEDILYLVEKMNAYFHLGAVSIRDGKEREVVFEDREYDIKGNMIKERHMHFQVAR